MNTHVPAGSNVT